MEKVSWADAQIFLTRLNAQQSANIPAGWAYVLPTEVAMGICLPSRYDHGIFLGGIRLRRAMLITHRVVLARRVMWATMRPTLGAFSICTEMSGSGPRTGTGTYSSGAQTDPTGPASGSSRVHSGRVLDIRHGPAFGHRAATAPRASATTPSASVSVSNSSELGTEG